MTGAAVKTVQALCTARGVDVDIDGVFGQNTKGGVVWVQQRGRELLRRSCGTEEAVPSSASADGVKLCEQATLHVGPVHAHHSGHCEVVACGTGADCVAPC